MSEAEETVVEDTGRDPKTGRFLAGNGGNGGRKKGARNKLSEAFLQDLHTAWLERGAEVINAAMNEKPDAVLRVIASLLPKDINLNFGDPLDDATEEEMRARLAQLDRILQHFIRTGGDGLIEGPVGEAGGQEAPAGVHEVHATHVC